MRNAWATPWAASLARCTAAPSYGTDRSSRVIVPTLPATRFRRSSLTRLIGSRMTRSTWRSSLRNASATGASWSLLVSRWRTPTRESSSATSSALATRKSAKRYANARYAASLRASCLARCPTWATSCTAIAVTRWPAFGWSTSLRPRSCAACMKRWQTCGCLTARLPSNSMMRVCPRLAPRKRLYTIQSATSTGKPTPSIAWCTRQPTRARRSAGAGTGRPSPA